MKAVEVSACGAPEVKDCQWLLDLSEGAYTWDWNCSNHARVIDFYKELIANDPVEPHTPLPYYYLIDNLLADHRTAEAKQAVEACAKLPAAKPFLLEIYRAHIALAEYDAPRADAILAAAMQTYGDNPGFQFEAAQYHARKCEYEEAIQCYETSYALEESEKPRFYDALEGIAVIYEIMGENEKAAATYDRILDNLKNEWHLTDEVVVREAEQQRARLLQKG